MNQYIKSLHSVRLHFVTDTAKNSSLQFLLQNVREKARQFFRVFIKKQNKLSSDSFRYQHRLPVEYFPNASVPSIIPKPKFITYRPGFIQRVTSNWVVSSLAKNVSKNALPKCGGPLLGFVGFALAKKPSLLTSDEEKEGVSFGIREAFAHVPWQCTRSDIIEQIESGKSFTFEDLKLEKMIAKGCNAAVYSACLHLDDSENVEVKDSLEVQKGDESTTKLIIPHSEGEQSLTSGVLKSENFERNNVAVKVMFNYSAESNAFAIWRAMYRESLPSVSEINLGEVMWNKIRKKRLKPHPNIVEMYFAFSNQLPLLPGAFENYPQALPQRLLVNGCGRNMTLFLVMKRYHCNLREFLKRNINPQTSLLLLTQLLEALTHLLQNDIAHRDLKTDNILLDLSCGVHSPRLVITDFGCCLESLQLAYPSHDIEKGGNLALMAPEIVNAEPGPFSILDYSRADLWTAGTIAYEIYGGKNPFYSTSCHLRNDSYEWTNLPPFPEKMPATVQKLVKDMLKVDPLQRPSPSLAATVCQVLLHAPIELSKSQPRKQLSRGAFEWMFKMSAKTYLEYFFKNVNEKSVKLELKHTFCSRIQFLDILKALEFIDESNTFM